MKFKWYYLWSTDFLLMLYHEKFSLHFYIVLMLFCHFPTSPSGILASDSCTFIMIQCLKTRMIFFQVYLNLLKILHSKTVKPYVITCIVSVSVLHLLNKHFEILVLTRILILHLTAFCVSSPVFLQEHSERSVTCDFFFCCLIGNVINYSFPWFDYTIAHVTLKCKPLWDTKLNMFHLTSKANKITVLAF